MLKKLFCLFLSLIFTFFNFTILFTTMNQGIKNNKYIVYLSYIVFIVQIFVKEKKQYILTLSSMILFIINFIIMSVN